MGLTMINDTINQIRKDIKAFGGYVAGMLNISISKVN